MMHLENILKQNELIREVIGKLHEQIGSLSEDIKKWRRRLNPPCRYCKHDGLYRCEECAENMFLGFTEKAKSKES